MNRLTLQSRLILAVILPCLALVIVGLNSLRGMSAMQAQTDRLYINTAAPMRAMAEVASRIPRMRVGIDMMLLQETDLRDERGIRSRIVDARTEDIPEMRQAIQAAVDAQVDPNLKASAEALLRQFDAVVRDELNPLLAALERNDLATAQRIYRDQYALTYNRMRADTNQLLDTLLQQAGNLHGLSQSRYASSKLQESLAVAVALLLSFVISWVMIQSLRRRVTFLRRTMADAAQNLALDTRIELGGKDELAEIGNSFNQFIEKVHRSIDAVALNSRKLSEMAHDVAERARLTQANSASQRDRTLQVAAAIHELGATVGEIASNAASAATVAREATVRSGEGRQVVLQASEQINELSSELEQASGVVSSLASAVDAIGSTLATIRGISEQTNLLALNAAIEAARAGDQGRGFAVVADEVRTLAGRSAASTEEIQQVIDRLQTESERAVAVMDKGRSQSGRVVEFAKRAQLALEEINGHIGRISDQNTQVATATEEQSSVVEDIDRNVGEINDITMQTTDIAQQLTDSSVALQQLSTQLDKLVGGFRL